MTAYKLPPPDFTLTTPRLTLRPYRPSDAAWYYEMSLANQVHLARYEAGNSIMTIHSLEDAQAVVERFANDWVEGHCFFLGAFLRQTGEFVCQVYVGPLSWELPEFTMGYIAEVSHEGQGYVTEAARAALNFIFEHLQAQRASLACDDSNARSYRVAERLGMLREAHFRQNHRYPDGTLTGTYHYAMLRSEWQALQAASQPGGG